MKILIFFLFFSNTFSKTIKPTDFCLKPTECEQTSDECQSYKCLGNISYECKGFCSTGRSSCQSILLWSSIIRSSNTFKKFTSEIRACPKYEWNGQDVCYNRNMCWNNQKKIECKCSGKFSHQCGDGYCAFNKYGCEKLKNANKNPKKKDIKDCIDEEKTKKSSLYHRLISLFSYSF